MRNAYSQMHCSSDQSTLSVREADSCQGIELWIVIGSADPDDDSLVWWGIIEEGQPPKQIIDGGEFFVLKR